MNSNQHLPKCLRSYVPAALTQQVIAGRGDAGADKDYVKEVAMALERALTESKEALGAAGSEASLTVWNLAREEWSLLQQLAVG